MTGTNESTNDPANILYGDRIANYKWNNIALPLREKIDNGNWKELGVRNIWEAGDTIPDSVKKALGGKLNTNAYNGRGIIPSYFIDNPVTNYNTGGTHESNSLGGIPIGDKARVEQDEVRVNFPDGDYIFSNRIPYIS